MSEFMSNLFGETFINLSMKQRQERLKLTQKDTQRITRELKRDRAELERKERQSMYQIKQFIQKGDFPKADMLARQVAAYRNASDRNFGRSIFIQTEAQLMASNHKVNRAQAEALQGWKFVNVQDSFEKARSRHMKYSMIAASNDTIESIMNEGFDDVYQDVETRRANPEFFDAEVEAIFKEAMNPKERARDYVNPEISNKIKKDPIRILVRSYEGYGSMDQGVAITIPTLDLSVDMLKRSIIKDDFAMIHLSLVTPGNLRRSSTLSDVGISHIKKAPEFNIGTVITKLVSKKSPDNEGKEEEDFLPEFQPFRVTESLKNLNITADSTIWIEPIRK